MKNLVFKKIFFKIFLAILFATPFNIFPEISKRSKYYSEEYKSNFKEFETLLEKYGITIIRQINRGTDKIIYKVSYKGEHWACSFYAPYRTKNATLKEIKPEDNFKAYQKDLKHLKKITEIIKKNKNTNLIAYKAECNNIIKEKNNEKIIGATLCIFTEYGDTDLDSYLFEKNGFDKKFTTKIELAINIANGVKTLHDLKLIHRDIKPKNIILVRDANNKLIGKLTDFTSIKNLKQEQIKKTKKLLGTINFLTPENISSHSNKEYLTIGEFTDIYALGITLYELFYELQFDQELKNDFNNNKEKYANKVYDYTDFFFYNLVNKNWRPKLDDTIVDSRINKIIQACWAQEPEDRPKAKEVLNALIAIKEETEN